MTIPRHRIPQEGLIGYWPCLDTIGKLGTVPDRSGNGKDLTLYADAVSDINNGMAFDGAGDYASCASAGLLPSTVMTAMCRVSLDANGNQYSAYMSNWDGGTNAGNAWTILKGGDSATDRKPHFAIRQSNGTQIVVTAATNLDLNTIYHIACVADGSNIMVYVNGVIDCTPVSYDGTINTTRSNPFFIGKLYTAGEYVTGKIADPAIYNRALSPAEIQRIYQQTMRR